MHPQLTHRMVLDKIAGFQQDARQYRWARAASARPRRRVRTALQLWLSACRDELECLRPHNRESEMS